MKNFLTALTLGLLSTGLQGAIVAPATAQAGAPNQVGTSMANFLKIGIGSRASSMGSAYVALADDATALYWNPGGIAMLGGSEAVLSTNNWILGTQQYFLGATVDLGLVGVFGLSVNTFDSGDIEETTVHQPDGTGRTFSAGNMAVGLTYARQMTDRFGAGITLKYITERLDRTSANAVAIDIGSVFVTDFLNNMRIGFNLSNLGSQMQLSGSDLLIQVQDDLGTKFIPADMSTEAWDLPLLFRFGVATDLVSNDMHRFTLATEVLDSRDFIYRLHGGAEWGFRDLLFLRGGYKFNYDDGNLSGGVGLQLPEFAGFGFRADYSFEAYEFLDNVQKITVLLRY